MNDRPEKNRAAPSIVTPSQKDDHWWDLCPICGSRLTNQKCRFVCSNATCGYFQSCNEFDT
jgi:hypothetical protein